MPRVRLSFLLLAVASLAGCRLLDMTTLRKENALSTPAPTPVFVRTHESDAWVRETFHVQQRYGRVLLVSQSPNPPPTLFVPPLDLNARPGAPSGQPIEYRVDQVFTSIDIAAGEARGGDLVAVMPGTYNEAVEVTPRPGAGDDHYVHFKAMGSPGDVIIRHEPPAGKSWRCDFVVSGSYTIIQGFNLSGGSTPGGGHDGTTAGVLLYSPFAETGRLVHHVAVLENYAHHQRMWGFHSVQSHTVLLQDNCFAHSVVQHGAYVSNGSDNYVIRRNVFFGNEGSGLQCNLDPDSCFQIFLGHPDMAAFGPYRHAHDDVARQLAAATAHFGTNNFPDGCGVNYIIEDNVANGNGREGGAAYNLAGLQDSLIQNNLAYANFGHGMACYNSAAADLDVAAAIPGPSRPDQATNNLAWFGSHSNLIRNNTVLMRNACRPDCFVLGLINGSYGNRLRNNIAINAGGDSILVTSASLYRSDSGYNVAASVTYASHYVFGTGSKLPPTPLPKGLKRVALNVDETCHTVTGVTLQGMASEFVRGGEEPWIGEEGHWWKLNPGRPDFHPRAGSQLLAGRGDTTELPPTDNEGARRDNADIGAFVAR